MRESRDDDGLAFPRRKGKGKVEKKERPRADRRIVREKNLPSVSYRVTVLDSVYGFLPPPLPPHPCSPCLWKHLAQPSARLRAHTPPVLGMVPPEAVQPGSTSDG